MFFNIIKNFNQKNDYKRITNLSANQLVYICSIENYGINYLVKGIIYEHYSLTKCELCESIDKGKTIRIDEKEYVVVKNNDKNYELKANKNALFCEYVLEEKDDMFYVYHYDPIVELWRKSDRKIEFIVSRDADLTVGGHKEKIEACDFGLPKKEWIIWSGLYLPIFLNGKVIKILEWLNY